MREHRRLRWMGAVLGAAIATAGCTPGAMKLVQTGTLASTSSSPGPSATAAPTAAHLGLVLDRDGKPAAGVKVVATLISQDGGSVVSNDGGSVVSNDGGSVVSNDGGSIISHGGGNLAAAKSRRLLATEAALTAVTDASGHFDLSLPTGRQANIEAVQGDDSKAIALAATSLDGLVLNLNYTGSITGRVTTPDDPTVTNFEGVQVFIPGTSYQAVTAKDGSYTISNVPVGTFTLAAAKPGLGAGRVPNVAVTAHGRITAGDLAMALARPHVTSIEPALLAVGLKNVKIHGDNFGASTGKPFQVSIGGATVSEMQRVDDQTIVVTVPASAASGDVTVTVDGTAGPGLKAQVVDELENAGTEILAGVPTEVEVGGTDTAGQKIQHVPVTLTSTDSGVSIDGTKITGKAAGTAKLAASFGNLTATVQVAIREMTARVTTLYADPGAANQLNLETAFAGLATGDDGTVYALARSGNAILPVSADGKAGTSIPVVLPADLAATGLVRREDGSFLVIAGTGVDIKIFAVAAAGGTATLVATTQAGTLGQPGTFPHAYVPASHALYGAAPYASLEKLDLGASPPAFTAFSDPKAWGANATSGLSALAASPDLGFLAILGAFGVANPGMTPQLWQVPMSGAPQRLASLSGPEQQGITELAVDPTETPTRHVFGLIPVQEIVLVLDLQNPTAGFVPLAGGNGKDDGADGMGTFAGLLAPAHLVFDTKGHLYVTEAGPRIRRVDIIRKP